MEQAVHQTPAASLPQSFRTGAHASANDTSNMFSSSPGFGSPAFPVRPRDQQAAAQKSIPAQPTFAPQFRAPIAQTVLPVSLPPQTLRPVAFRTLTKKHNLTITSSGLGALATFVGRFCGTGWREEGLAEKVLDEVAKQWKLNNGGLILDDDAKEKKLRNILKGLEPRMTGGKLDLGRLSRTNSTVGSLSRQGSMLSRSDSTTSFGMSGLEVQEEEQDELAAASLDPRAYLKVIDAFKQPRVQYSSTKRTLEILDVQSSLLPDIQRRVVSFRNRFHLVHQRLMRNEAFQTKTLTGTSATLSRSASSLTTQQGAYKITSVSNLLGRSGSSHLLLGLLVHNATGSLALTDLSGSVVLDLSTAHSIPELASDGTGGAWFLPGMIVLIEGQYEDDGSNNSGLGGGGGVGGQIKGVFHVDTVAGPPAERRDVTLGLGHDKRDGTNIVSGAGFGYFDFLGVGSEKAVGPWMRRIQKRIYHDSKLGYRNSQEDLATSKHLPPRSKLAILSHLSLDIPSTITALRAILKSYSTSPCPPLSIAFLGPFTSQPLTPVSDPSHYKASWDTFASLLLEFTSLLSSTTLIFVPGDNDPWASTFSLGAGTILPRTGIPDLFTNRVRRALQTANTEHHRSPNTITNISKDRDKDNSEGPIQGEIHFTSNPARLSLFGPSEEIVLFRDDITSRIRRNAILFPDLTNDDLVETHEEVNNTNNPQAADEQNPLTTQIDAPDPILDQDTAMNQPSAAPSTTTTTTNTTGQSTTTTTTTTSVSTTTTTTTTAKRLTKLLLDQAHLSPFSPTVHPTFWDFSSSLSLYPLPTCLVIADSTCDPFTLVYEGCHVLNPGRLVDEKIRRGRGVARWVEYNCDGRRAETREMRF